ncbi:TPA: terminase [Clostridioides difficile]|nr:terminase [Clostridioides difficile]TQW69011.1 terminase [Clostridioides difficile]TQW93238.1 terminase [Clostridioides difficile]HAU5011699.1 terminase [Clostridioides difficile]HAU5018142.1 terminase [Clostridioides difficile]
MNKLHNKKYDSNEQRGGDVGRARSPNRDKALEIYLKHDGNIELTEIAKILKLPQGTIRGWKNKDKWEAKLNGTLQNNSERSKTKRNKGGQPNNTNAKGHGAPLRNKNNFKHGIFEQIYFDTLTDKELELIKNKSNDKIYDLELEIDLLTIREHRHMSRIKEYTEKTDGISLESVNKRRLEIKGNVLKNGQVQEEMVTRGVSTFEVIQKLEAELTKIQDKKRKCIETLEKMKIDRKKFELENNNLGQNESENMFKELSLEELKRLASLDD